MTTNPTTNPIAGRSGVRGLPPGAGEALAAALESRLRANRHQPDGGYAGDPEAPAAALWDNAGRDELLDALWDAGLLAVPGGAPRPPLYREPPGLPVREQIRDQVADALDPFLRKVALTESNGSAWVGEQSAQDLAGDATFAELVDALWDAGLLIFDYTDDRAHLRAGWAAMGAALHTLAAHEDLAPDLLARVPKSHVGYLLGQQALRQQLREAWGRIEAAKMLLATVRDRHDGDLGYLRTNLGVLQGLLAGRVHWSMSEPRDAGEPADASLYDEVRHRSARVAVDAERLFAAAGDAMLSQRSPAVGPTPDGARAVLATQHLFAHRAALYAWGVAALLGYIREQLDDEHANDAAAIVDMIGEHGDPPYVDDLPRPADDPDAHAELVASWMTARPARTGLHSVADAAARGEVDVEATVRPAGAAQLDQIAGRLTYPRPVLAQGDTARTGGIAAEMLALEELALDVWRRRDWAATTAALPGPLRELLADAADRAIDRYNAGVQAAGYSGMLKVDRWWTKSPAGPVERVLRFLGGPRHGDQHVEPLALLPTHGMPHTAPDGGVRWTFAQADAWPGEERYCPAGYDDRGRLLMVWRNATDEEIAEARAERDERDADRAQEIALDEAAAAAREDGTS